MTIKPYSRKINYYETDMMGIVHHSNYIRYFEEARIDLMNQINCSVSDLEDNGISIANVDAFAKYIVPLRFDDNVVITSRLSGLSPSKMQFEYEIRFKNSDILAANGKTTHCCLNTSKKPLSIRKADSKLYERLQDLLQMQ